MDTTTTVTCESREGRSKSDYPGNIQNKLELLLAENAAFLKYQNNPSLEKEELLASVVRNPITTENAVARLGLLTGLIPTSAIFLKILTVYPDDPAFPLMLLIAIVTVAVTSAAGYFSGRLVSIVLSDLERKNWALMILALPFVGIVWGLMSGAVGGVVLFGIGAIFGAAIGAMTASIVLTVFGILHRLLKTGDVIERNQFLPVAFGLTIAIAAFILGL